jgi:chemotaxis protein CheX
MCLKVEFLNPFISAATRVIAQLCGGDIEQGQIAVRSALVTTQQISIMVVVSGHVEGRVMYGMSPVTATKIASAMIESQHVIFNELALSAISELGNIISGNAAQLLAKSGFVCDMTPPTIVRGVNVEIASVAPSLVVPLYARCGKLDIHISLREALMSKQTSEEGLDDDTTA